jgi:tRNA-Thr(GGU) m(6)t(6)A37 methyltransferase TsaA
MVVALNGNRRHGPARAGRAAVRLFRRGVIGLGFAALVLSLVPALASDLHDPSPGEPVYSVHPIGWVRKSEGRTTIVIDERYQPALLGVETLDAVWVLYWFDRNDNPAARSVVQVHPQGNPENPLRGVFATRSPFRPNLIALSRVKILGVRDNVIEIDGIDAFPETPVLDLKP